MIFYIIILLAILAYVLVMWRRQFHGPLTISQEQIRAMAKGMSNMTDEEREELRKTMERP